MAEFRIKGWHVLAAVLGFFGVTIAVNATFITLAVSTFSGEVSDEPYAQGLDFNDTLAERRRQAEIGWTATMGADRATDGAARIEVTVRNAQGREVTGLDVSGVLGRPATMAEDRTVVFTEAGASYIAVVDDLADGAWELTARTTMFDGSPFEAHRRIWLR